MVRGLAEVSGLLSQIFEAHFTSFSGRIRSVDLSNGLGFPNLDAFRRSEVQASRAGADCEFPDESAAQGLTVGAEETDYAGAFPSVSTKRPHQ
jgi:hypothetical protein